jgi:hypothetical protein
LWFKFKPNELSLPQLFEWAKSRWPIHLHAPIALYVLRQYNSTHVAIGDSFCGYDNRTVFNTLDYYKNCGLTHVSV